MKESLLLTIANEFGVELNEKFYAYDENDDNLMEMIITEKYIYEIDEDGNVYIPTGNNICALLNGKYCVKQYPADMKRGDKYYTYTLSNGVVELTLKDGYVDRILLVRGRLFKTYAEAEKKYKEVRKETEEKLKRWGIHCDHTNKT